MRLRQKRRAPLYSREEVVQLVYRESLLDTSPLEISRKMHAAKQIHYNPTTEQILELYEQFGGKEKFLEHCNQCIVEKRALSFSPRTENKRAHFTDAELRRVALEYNSHRTWMAGLRAIKRKENLATLRRFIRERYKDDQTFLDAFLK